MIPHDRRLMCSVIKIEYNFVARAGRLTMDDDNCCDMQGCINLFCAVDADVKEISTYAGNRPDTAYKKQRNGVWLAIDCR